MVMSRIMVMSNFMNFQDFYILSNGMFEIRSYIYVKCDSRHFCPTNSLPIAIWSKQIGGCFSLFFPLIIPSPIGSPKEDPHPRWTTPFWICLPQITVSCRGQGLWDDASLARCMATGHAKDFSTESKPPASKNAVNY